jgi:S-adenosylmethionine decarboxylase
LPGSTETYGDHFLVDLHGCNAAVIADVEPTQEALLAAAERCGSTIIKYFFHQFSPTGVSGVILIAESHFSVHTWPENNFVAVDIYTSGEVMQPDIAITFLKDAFTAERVEIVRVTRGQIEADAHQDHE